MKFVFMTDLHGRANNPISRTDNFPEAILKKCDWVVNYANQIDAVILCGGDWLQRPDTSPNFIAALAKILMKAKRGVYSVLGNHDMYSYNIESFTRTPLYLLFACNIIKLLSDKDTLFCDEDTDIHVTGVSSHPMLDKNGNVKDYLAPDDLEINADKKNFYIHIVHGFLADKQWPQSVPHTLIEDTVLKNHADVVLTGHEHTGYNIIEKEWEGHKIIYCNPGSLARVTAGVGDMRDDVRVALIDTNNKAQPVSLISVPVRKAEDVIDRERLKEEKQRANSIEAFATRLSDIQEEVSQDSAQHFSSAVEMLSVYVNKVRTSEGGAAEWITDSIIDLAKRLLTESEEAMAKSRAKRRADE